MLDVRIAERSDEGREPLSHLAVVRAATRAAHAKIEALPSMVRLMSDDFSPAEYRAHLARLLGFYEPLESALARSAGDVRPPLLRSRFLIADLLQLGLTLEQICALPRCELPSIASPGAFGALYVYEGAALGGQVIARRLQRFFRSERGFAFYRCDALGTRDRWIAFCNSINAAAAENQAAICDAALAVFDAFCQWFEREDDRTAGDV